EHACGTGDRDPHSDLLRRAVRSDPRAQTFLGGSSLEDGGGYPYPRTSRGTAVSPTTKAPSLGTGPSHRVRHQGLEPRARWLRVSCSIQTRHLRQQDRTINPATTCLS